ncbi:MAG: site-specific DNA-methyltransferase [Candidatus Heimdallarchaeota archaeon]|nr:site-specific DNA-methyltransferase [Candidatus Heimdallarchaeota archaeon]
MILRKLENREQEMALLEDLISLLQQDERLVSDGELLKNRIVELALKLDQNLMKLLISNKKAKEHFFEKVDQALIFNKEKFMKFVDNKAFLPDSYTAFKNKIGLMVDKNYIVKSKEVVLSWPYKDCILEGGQAKEEEKRKEIFHNEILAPDEIDRLLDPKVFTDFKRIDAKGEQKVSKIKPDDNLVIRGNNLLILHSLEKKYAGKIKLIYIDPPYNTGNDGFKYNDNFNHSTWLTFMRNRLEIAQKLLREDGVIFIHIGDQELHYLKVLCDEAFGRENFLNTIARVQKKGSDKGNYFSPSIDFILPYAKKKESLPDFTDEIDESIFDKVEKEGPRKGERYEDSKSLYQSSLDERSNQRYYIECPDGSLVIPPGETFPEEKKDGAKVTPNEGDGCWRWSVDYGYEERRDHLVFKETRNSPLLDEHGKQSKWNVYTKRYLTDAKERGNSPRTFWIDFLNAEATRDLKQLDVSFQFSKPKELIKYILKIVGVGDGDIVLDFFAGSGTTAHAVLELNKEDGIDRKFILIEQLQEHIEVCNKRIQKVMQDLGKQKNLLNFDKQDDNYIFCELKEFNENFVQEIARAKDSKELLKIWEKMKNHAFLSYRVDTKLFDNNIAEFKGLSPEKQKKLLIECLDHNNLYINYSEIKDEQHKASKEEIELNRKFYGEI